MTLAVVDGYLNAIRECLRPLPHRRRPRGEFAGFASKRRLYEEALYGIAPGTPPDMFFTNRAGLRGLYLGGHTTFPACGAPTAMLSQKSRQRSGDAGHARESVSGGLGDRGQRPKPR